MLATTTPLVSQLEPDVVATWEMSVESGVVWCGVVYKPKESGVARVFGSKVRRISRALYGSVPLEAGALAKRLFRCHDVRWSMVERGSLVLHLHYRSRMGVLRPVTRVLKTFVEISWPESV